MDPDDCAHTDVAQKNKITPKMKIVSLRKFIAFSPLPQWGMRSRTIWVAARKIGECAAPILPLLGSTHQVVNEEIFLFTQRVVHVAQFAKRQELMLQLLLPAEAEQQPA